ncbi:MAG: hypothetical protein HFH15_09490 [Ruminococcus sp.]|nr:hypothetical protein [Ruminococcus sp.]
MEGKEKIVLNDGAEYPIENGASENQVQVVLQDVAGFPDVYKKFTESNLEHYQIQNAEGLTCATKANKYLVDAVVAEQDSNVLVTFRLADVDMIRKELDGLKADVGVVQAGQDLQDGAIADLGEIVGGMMKGGEA